MAAPMSEVRLERRGSATVLTIDRPAAHNAISRDTMEQLAGAVAQVRASDARVLAVRGAGDRVFVSGGDLKELAAIREHADAVAMALRMRSLLDDIASLPIPVVAAINGHAFGGGCETAVACDFRIAVDSARLAFNQIDLAIMPAWGGIERLQALVGRARALYLTTTGYPLDAATARDWGLVEEVVDRDRFDDRLGELLDRIASAPLAALTGIKRAASRAQPPTRPDLALDAADSFADTWITDAHWHAVERARDRRRTAREGAPGPAGAGPARPTDRRDPAPLGAENGSVQR
jgi:enoyl-CoA hydratase/carnithine racemase